MDQRNRIVSPEINPHTYTQLILDKGGRNIHEGKTISSASDVGKTGELHTNQWKYSFTPCKKLTWKWLKELKINTIKILKENIGKTFSEKKIIAIFSSISLPRRNKSKSKQV